MRKAILKCLSPSQREEARLLYPSLAGPKPQSEKVPAIEDSSILLLSCNLKQLLKRIASYYQSLVKRVTSPRNRRIEKLANAVGTVNIMPD
ncbi:MAG: hypothetical protein GYA55_04685 [SAR324 cluster bacterium]|uniref:Uncharacterized protein n=1 Tax=SAR324 cluster bacterium TaxID=2024889 RepID=A0A7X9IKZ4_9DELT|nr:hypothetical protein [SAR324 cluster bacterium]